MAIAIGAVLFGMAQSLLGGWSFFGFYYQGEKLDPINPALRIEFQFSEDKRSVLRYWRVDEEGFCERHALYDLQASPLPGKPEDTSTLYQRVVWVHPGNRPDCSQDPDMLFGQESWSPVKITEGDQGEEFQLELPLGEETITFRFKRQGL